MNGGVLSIVFMALGLLGCARSRPPGMLAPDEPVQDALAAPGLSFDHHGVTLTPLARFRVTARVLGAERYRFDREARLAPVDLALGWGPMSDSAILRDIDIMQTGRVFLWSAHELPIAEELIVSHAANMHMIPATRAVEHRLEQLRAGDLVTFSGALVSATTADGWTWTTSMSRLDTGAGACELVWAESLSVR